MEVNAPGGRLDSVNLEKRNLYEKEISERVSDTTGSVKPGKLPLPAERNSETGITNKKHLLA